MNENLKQKSEIILRTLQRNGCRITKQRKIILDIILEKDCCCCKEIYYQAAVIDPAIGMATVYRMLSTLEEMGAINRCLMYRIGEDWITSAAQEKEETYEHCDCRRA